MIIRIIIYISIILYFIWDYRKDMKPFKIQIAPIIAITFFAGTEYFQKLDNRLQLILLIVAILFTIRYAWNYYRDNKVQRFKEKKRLRAIREQERLEQHEKVLGEIFEVKNKDLRSHSSSYEIIMEVSGYKRELDGQLSFGITRDQLLMADESEEEIIDIMEEQPVLENQIDMFS